MSQPSRRKTRVASPERPRRDSGPAGMPSPARIFESALRAARGIHATDDPLQPEVLVSGLLGTFDRPLIDVADTVDFLGQRLVSYLVDKRSPDALALVHGIAALADEPLAASARQGILRLRTAGRADPAFAGRIGRYRFLDAWTSIDEFGDQEMVAASFVDPADQAHALAFMIDHNFEGLVREAFLAPDLEGIRTTWAETSGMAIVALDAQALADRLGQGLRMYDLYLDPPCSDDVRELAVLMKARLRALPPARELERPEVPDEERDALVAAFAASREAGRSDQVADLTRYFVDYRCDYADGDPLRWSPIAVELCLLDWFPRKVTLDDRELAAVPDALRRFVRFSGRRKGLSRDLVAETLSAVDEFESQFLAAMRDPKRFGPAKSIVDEMLGRALEPVDANPVTRRQWTMPPMSGSVRGIDAALLDPSDPDERRMLIELDHPELLAALERGDHTVEIDGSPVNPRLHIELHEIVVAQLWDGEPPETWEAAQRLRAFGHDRHEILHRLAGVVAGVAWTGLHRGEPQDLNTDLRTALRALPSGRIDKGRRRLD